MTGEDVSARQDTGASQSLEQSPTSEAPAQLEAAPESETVFCPQCGSKMAAGDRYCGGCGWDAENPDVIPQPKPPRSPRDLGPPSDKNRLTALLLCILLGFLGVHRFYVGRPGSGIVWILTLGVLSVGWIYDTVMIATGEFTDDQGRRLLHWE